MLQEKHLRERYLKITRRDDTWKFITPLISHSQTKLTATCSFIHLSDGEINSKCLYVSDNTSHIYSTPHKHFIMFYFSCSHFSPCVCAVSLFWLIYILPVNLLSDKSTSALKECVLAPQRHISVCTRYVSGPLKSMLRDAEVFKTFSNKKKTSSYLFEEMRNRSPN